MPYPTDPRTRVAVQGTYLRQAIEAMRRAASLEDQDDVRGLLTGACATVALISARNDRNYADLAQQASGSAAASAVQVAATTQVAPVREA